MPDGSVVSSEGRISPGIFPLYVGWVDVSEQLMSGAQ